MTINTFDVLLPQKRKLKLFFKCDTLRDFLEQNSITLLYDTVFPFVFVIVKKEGKKEEEEAQSNTESPHPVCCTYSTLQ